MFCRTSRTDNPTRAFLSTLLQPTSHHVLAFILCCNLWFAAHSRAQSIPAEITAYARVYTGAVTGDADDPAIWIHPTDPALSLIIGTDKAGDAVYVWNMQGQQLQRIPLINTPNNGDVRYGMEVGGAPVDIYVVGAEDPSRVVVFKIDPNTRALSDITTAGGILTPQVKAPYGVALYRRSHDGAMYVFVDSNGGTTGVLHQYQLFDDGAGRVRGVFVRSFGLEYNGHHSEGIVADDDLGYVYIAEEDCCVHKFYADPAMGNLRLAVFAQADGIESDREGLAIYGCADGTGYLLLSSQGNKRIKVYRREGDLDNPHSHTLVTTIYTPELTSTDGLVVEFWRWRHFDRAKSRAQLYCRGHVSRNADEQFRLVQRSRNEEQLHRRQRRAGCGFQRHAAFGQCPSHREFYGSNFGQSQLVVVEFRRRRRLHGAEPFAPIYAAGNIYGVIDREQCLRHC